MTEFKKAVLEYVAKIPYGKVDYFSRISERVGGTARTVGWLLSGLSVEECDQVPWQRVVAKDGYISALKLGAKGIIQKQLLEDEGHMIIDDKVDIKSKLWY
jgi:methylated-DNA-protein-cysteine methyltransferase related protein